MDDLKLSYEGDKWAGSVLQQQQEGTITDKNVSVFAGTIRCKNKLYVGTHGTWRSDMIQAIHNSSVGGHSGILGTYQRMKKLFYWPGMKQMVVEVVGHCDICQMNKGEHVASPGLLEPIPIPEGAWELLTMDFIGGLPKSEGK